MYFCIWVGHINKYKRRKVEDFEVGFCVCVCVCDTRGCTQGLMLATQVLLHLSHSAGPFYTSYFWGRVSVYVRVSLDGDPSICTSLHSWDDRHVSPRPVIGWNGVSHSFCPGQPQTKTCPISVSQVARITGLSHCAQPKVLKHNIKVL
jgi:hypothetical protein